MIQYTSGTTGQPKGVKITHQMMMHSAQSMDIRMKAIEAGDTLMCHLQAAMSFEASLLTLATLKGANVAFGNQENIESFMQDVSIMKPHVIATSPDIPNQISKVLYDQYKGMGGCKVWMTERACNSKKEYLYEQGEDLKVCFNNTLFNQFTQIMGNQLKLVISAPSSVEVLSQDTSDFLRTHTACPIVHAYRMAETCGAAMMT